MERVDHAGGDAGAQNLRQMGHIGRQLAAEQHVHDAAVHAPPVVDGAAIGAGLVPHPAAVQNGADDVLIELAPVPERRGQVLQHAARAHQKCAELPLRAVRHRCVAARDDRDALLSKDVQRVNLVGQTGPLQVDADIGVRHPRAERECVDVGRHAEAGVVGHIADAVPARHGTGNRAGDELGLIHAGVVGADAGVGHLHRAVQDVYLRVLDGGAQGRAYQLRAGRKDDIRTVGDRLLDKGIGVLARDGVEVGCRLDLALKHSVQLGTAKLMLACPGAGAGGTLMHKGNLQMAGRGVLAGQDKIQQAGLLRGGGLVADLHGIRFCRASTSSHRASSFSLSSLGLKLASSSLV